MWMSSVPWQGRALIVLLLVLASIASGAILGMRYESNSRDARELKAIRTTEERFMRALANGRAHAVNEIEWRNRSRIYYRNWQERLNHVSNSQLAACPQPFSSAPGHTDVLLGAVWVGMYNAAWLPGIDGQSDSGGIAGEIIETATATPREVLANAGENARLCAEDRKRLDELIDHLNEVEAMR